MIIGDFNRSSRMPKRLAPMSQEASIALQELTYADYDLSNIGRMSSDLNSKYDSNFNSEKVRRISKCEQESKPNTQSDSEYHPQSKSYNRLQTVELANHGSEGFGDPSCRDKHSGDSNSESNGIINTLFKSPDRNAKSTSKNNSHDDLHDDTSTPSNKLKSRGLTQALPNKYRHGESNPRGNNSCSDFVSHVDSGYVEGDMDSRFQSKKSNVRFTGETDDLRKTRKTNATHSDENKICELRTGPPSPENFSDIFPESRSSSSNVSDRDFRDIIIPINGNGIDKWSRSCRADKRIENNSGRGANTQSENIVNQNLFHNNIHTNDLSLSCSNLNESNYIETVRNNGLSKSKDFISTIRTHNDIETVGSLTARTATQTKHDTMRDKGSRTERSNTIGRTKPVTSSLNRRTSLNVTLGSSDVNLRKAVRLPRDGSPSTRQESVTQKSTAKATGPRLTDLKRSSSVPRLARTVEENTSNNPSYKVIDSSHRNQIDNSQAGVQNVFNIGNTPNPVTVGPGRPGVADSTTANHKFSALESIAAATAERKAATQRRREEAARDRELAVMRIQQQGQLEQQQKYWFKVSCIGYDSRFSRDILPVVEDVDEEELRLEEEYRAIAVSKCEAWLKKHYMDSKDL